MEQNQTNDKTQTENNLPSLDLIFRLTQDSMTDQLATVNTLDTKSGFVLGSSTLILGAAVLLRPSLSSCSTSTIRTFLLSLPGWLQVFIHLGSRSLPILLLITYLVMIYAAYRAYVLGRRYASISPIELYQNYVFKSEQQTKAEVFRAMVEIVAINGQEVRRKGMWTNFAIKALLVEAIILAIPLLAQSFCQ